MSCEIQNIFFISENGIVKDISDYVSGIIESSGIEKSYKIKKNILFVEELLV